MIKSIEISCDLGEAANESERHVEAQIWPLIAAANIACGGHAGDADTMWEAAERARALGVILGAHPSYPDREGFGRRRLEIASDALHASLVEQIATMRKIAEGAGTPMERVKPHGALYNEAHHDESLARIIAAAIHDAAPAAAAVCSPGSALEKTARELGLSVILEAFADRRYRSDGSLLSRSEAGSLLLDPAIAAEQACLLASEGRVIDCDGKSVSVHFDTICIHADMERSPDRLRAIRRQLESHSFTVMAVRRK